MVVGLLEKPIPGVEIEPQETREQGGKNPPDRMLRRCDLRTTEPFNKVRTLNLRPFETTDSTYRQCNTCSEHFECALRSTN